MSVLHCATCHEDMVGNGVLISPPEEADLEELSNFLSEQAEENGHPTVGYFRTTEERFVFPLHPNCWAVVFSDISKVEDPSIVVDFVLAPVPELVEALGIPDEGDGG